MDPGFVEGILLLLQSTLDALRLVERKSIQFPHKSVNSFFA